MKLQNNKKSYRKPKKNFKILQISVVGVTIIVVALSTVLVGNATNKNKKQLQENLATAPADTAIPFEVTQRTTISPEELEHERIQQEKALVIVGYNNLGIVQVTGFLNVREAPDTGADIIGKLFGDSACEILEVTESGWMKISSGNFEGYISSQFVLTGQEASEKALELVALRAIIKADSVNIRKEASKESEAVGKVMQNERYVVISQTEGWVEINSGFISSDYVDVKYALNEARKLGMREMVINLYDNLGMSNVTSYLNIRDKASEDGKIIGKMTSKSAGEILETVDGWYKIKSGPVTGYVKSDFILTGNEAKSAAMQAAELMVIVKTDGLNVRSEPTTESSIWTQLTSGERYLVLSQQDGWAEIEMDITTGFVSTDYVEVRYALEEAIKFTPLVEKASSTSGSGGSPSGSSTTQSKRNQIVNYALGFLGNPYVWGGTSLTNGADCSGFTLSVYSKFGVSLPHHSGSQAGKGKSISSGEMRPGDLVFYTDSSGTINHVAMYIGNEQVVHASNPKNGIKISAWNYRKSVKIVNVLGD